MRCGEEVGRLRKGVDSQMTIVSMSRHLSLPIAIHWLINGGGVSEQFQDWAVPLFLRTVPAACSALSISPANQRLRIPVPQTISQVHHGKTPETAIPLGLLQKLSSRPNPLVAAASSMWRCPPDDDNIWSYVSLAAANLNLWHLR